MEDRVEGHLLGHVIVVARFDQLAQPGNGLEDVLARKVRETAGGLLLVFGCLAHLSHSGRPVERLTVP